jgi:hypothetical protein
MAGLYSGFGEKRRPFEAQGKLAVAFLLPLLRATAQTAALTESGSKLPFFFLTEN